MQYAFIENDEIKMFGALPYLWAPNENSEEIDLHSCTIPELEILGWNVIFELGRRPYNITIEEEIIDDPKLINHKPVIYYSYKYRENYKEILFNNVVLSAEFVANDQRALNQFALDFDKIKKSLNPQEEAVMESTKEVAFATGEHRKGLSTHITFRGHTIKLGQLERQRLMIAGIAYSAIKKVPDDFALYDINDNKIVVDLDFLIELLVLITNRDFKQYDTFIEKKIESKNKLIQKLM